MKVFRSTKCSTKFATKNKINTIEYILKEYSKVVNIFIDHFWLNPHQMDKAKLLKNLVDLPKDTWLSARLRKVAAREAIDMILSVTRASEENKKALQENIDDLKKFIEKNKNRKMTSKTHKAYLRIKCNTNKLRDFKVTKPMHTGKRMCVSCTIGTLLDSKSSKEFDMWLQLRSIGEKISIDIPLKKQKHYLELESKGKRLNAYIITPKYVQLCFEIETGSKLEYNTVVGLDSGINALASLSTGVQFGKDIKECIERVKGCKKGSEGKKKAIRALKQRIDEIAIEVLEYLKENKCGVLVVEKLRNMTRNSKLKGRLSKNMRSSIGSWNYRYWLRRLELGCEIYRISFRTVNPYNTSIECSDCGYSDSGNRSGEVFICLGCGHTKNADINASINIAGRFLTGKYGSGYKLLTISI